MPIRTITAATILLALLAGSPGAAVAQPEIKASVFSTASGTTQSGSLALTSIVGQPSSTGVLSDGVLTIRSGFLKRRIRIMPGSLSILHTPPASHSLGQDLQVAAEITGTEVAQAEVAYRRGGDAAFTSAPLTASGSRYTGTIPASFVTDEGLAYTFTATDIHGNVVRNPALGAYSVRVALPEPGISWTLPQPGGASPSGYRLLSIPLVLTDARPDAVLSDDLGPYDNTRWRFYALQFDQSVAEFPNAATMDPGKAFWLIVRDEGGSIDTGAGRTVPLNAPYRLALHPRWNLVGTPFNFPIPVENLRTASGQAFELRAFNGSWNDPISARVTEMLPFTGYAVFNNLQTVDSLYVSPPSVASEAGKTQAAQEETPAWFVRIIADHREARDADNVAGVMPHSAPGVDAFDLPEPPVIGSFISVYFPHPEWGQLTERFTTDWRPSLAEGDVWPLELVSNVDGAVQLSFEGVNRVPPDLEVWLLDEALGITQNLRVTPRYTLLSPAIGTVKRLTLTIGRPAFVQETLGISLAETPASYEAPSTYPNPFRTSTAIHYTLPEAERVTLEVYTLLGRKIATLLDDQLQQAGRHLTVWNGTDENNHVVASGLYLFRFRTASFAATTTAILVR